MFVYLDSETKCTDSPVCIQTFTGMTNCLSGCIRNPTHCSLSEKPRGDLLLLVSSVMLLQGIYELDPFFFILTRYTHSLTLANYAHKGNKAFP